MKRGVVDLSLLALMHSLQHIYHGALPPLYLLLRAEFSVSTFQIGLIGSVFGFISILQGPAGYLSEVYRQCCGGCRPPVPIHGGGDEPDAQVDQ